MRCFAVYSLLLVIVMLGSQFMPPGSVRATGIAPDGGAPQSTPASARNHPPRPAQVLMPQQVGTPMATPTPDLTDLMQQLDAAWNAQNWPEALRIIGEIMAINPTYDAIQDRKYHAHINYGYELLTQGECTDALAQFREAQAMRPDGEEALVGLELVSRYCATPVPATATFTPVPTPEPTLSVTAPPPAPTATPTPQVITQPIRYTVQPGDTLYSLAQRYSTTVQAIMQANGMMSYFLRAGDEIWIPASVPPPGPLVHIVHPGETLLSIAQLYTPTVWAIMTANRLRSYTIWAYQALYIPTAYQPGPIIHIVQPGETLFSIAQSYNTTVPLIMMANRLRSYAIYVYQRLLIPPAGWTGWPPLWPGMYPPDRPYGPRYYVVQPGDTLFSIAQRFGTTIAALKAANGLVGSTIYAGTTLRIP